MDQLNKFDTQAKTVLVLAETDIVTERSVKDFNQNTEMHSEGILAHIYKCILLHSSHVIGINVLCLLQIQILLCTFYLIDTF